MWKLSCHICFNYMTDLQIKKEHGWLNARTAPLPFCNSNCGFVPQRVEANFDTPQARMPRLLASSAGLWLHRLERRAGRMPANNIPNSLGRTFQWSSIVPSSHRFFETAG